MELPPPFSPSLERICTTEEFYTLWLPEAKNSSSVLTELNNIEKLKDTSLYLCTVEQWKIKRVPEKLRQDFFFGKFTGLL